METPLWLILAGLGVIVFYLGTISGHLKKIELLLDEDMGEKRLEREKNRNPNDFR